MLSSGWASAYATRKQALPIESFGIYPGTRDRTKSSEHRGAPNARAARVAQARPPAVSTRSDGTLSRLRRGSHPTVRVPGVRAVWLGAVRVTARRIDG